MEPGWNVLSDNSYTDGDGVVHVLGEIYNNTGVNQEEVIVWVAFYDDTGRQIAEEWTAPIVEVVPQDVMMPFSVETEPRFPYAEYTISVEGEATERQPRQDLEVLNHTGSLDDSYRITGELRNPGESLSTYAEIIATLYDSAGRVVNVGYAFVPADGLEGEPFAPFEVLVEQPHDDISTYTFLTLGF